MTPDIEIRLLKEDELEKVNNLYNHLYGNKRPLKNFEWEFLNGPAGKAIYVVAVDKANENIVGTQCAIPLFWRSPEGEKILTAKSEDTLVDPKYRGMKIFEKMYDLLFKECEKAGVHCIWGFTYALKPFQKIGFSVPFFQQQGILVIHPFQAVEILSKLNPSNSFKDKTKIAALCLAAWVRNLLVVNSSGESISVTEEKVTDKIDLLKNSTVASNYFLWEDDTYYKWRITDNPFTNNAYSEVTLKNSKGETAVNVIVNLKKNGVGYIEQILASQGAKEQTIRVGMSKAISVMRKSGASLIRFWGFDYSVQMKGEISLLKKCGFVFVKKGTGFVFYDFKRNGKSISPDTIMLNRIYTQGND